MDAEAFRANLRRWLAGPVDGIVVAGSTGEAPLLDEIEVLRLVEWARQATPDGRPVVAGTGLESTRATVRMCREVARKGADAVLVRPPAYYADAMDREAVRDHFLRVADGSPVPVILYHIPRYVPVGLEPGLVAELARHETVAGIKDSAGDIRRIGTLVEGCGDRASVLVGAGTLLYGGLEVGASGGVVAAGLLATRACGELIEACRGDDDARAGALQERVGSLHRAVVGKLGVPGVKAGLDRLGLAGGPVRGPLRGLGRSGRDRVERALGAADALDGDAGPPGPGAA